MIVRRILVTGATGTVGRQVVAQLLDSGAHVRALTRDPNRAALPRDVELVRGDLTAPETMDASVRDVDAVFLVWTAAADAFPAALARIAQHTGRLVMLTSPHQTPHPFFQQPNPMASMHKNMERLIRESGLTSAFVPARGPATGPDAVFACWSWSSPIGCEKKNRFGEGASPCPGGGTSCQRFKKTINAAYSFPVRLARTLICWAAF